ncbi:ParA family protein [uncultured Desulfovibrio sp.]|uniref:ParA family protein n=3 Tax=uncultured Desulfovibrio sp. TaxID=167968 RepID=UPI0025F3AF53|nr:ParA family protein [uncultured Desulfovibrio sp.]
MPNSLDRLVDRQYNIAQGVAKPLPLPRYDTYSICNLRGGIGKTSLAFNLTYLANSVLSVDTCPQCNLTWFFDNNYLQNSSVTVYDMLLPNFVPGLGSPSHIAKSVSATNMKFNNRNAYYLPSDARLYILPSQVATSIVQAQTVSGQQQIQIIDNILFALKNNIKREMQETQTTRCIIDTSPFFSGATHLSWHASDALIIPVRTDQQSVNALSLLLKTLSDPASEFRKIMPSNGHTPKIQMIVLTHCGWSTVPGARNRPNQQTKIYIEKVLDIIRQNITQFTTSDPTNHLLLLDDFLGTGRISSAKATPIPLLHPGESMTIDRVRAEVNQSVEKIQNQLKYIHDSIW